MTDLAAPPAPTPAAAAPGPARGSLVRAEVHRLVSRRFIRLLVLLGLAGYLLIVSIAATQFGRTTPALLAEAEREVTRIVAEQDAFREQCLADPGRPADLPVEAACGAPARAADFRAEDFLAKQPFVLVEGLAPGAIGVAVGTSVLAFLLGATWVGAEWSSRSMVALLFWEPRRMRVMAVKLGVLAAAVAALAVLGQALWYGTARLFAAALGRTGDLPDGFWTGMLGQSARSVLLVVIAALLGFGLANLVRNTGAALGVGFVWFAIVENAVRGLRPRWQEWLLTDNAAALLNQGGYRLFLPSEGFVDESGAFVETPQEVLLSNLHGGLVLGLATALVVGIGVLLFARRDLH